MFECLDLSSKKLSVPLKNTSFVTGKKSRISAKTLLFYGLILFIVTLGLEELQSMSFNCPCCISGKKSKSVANARPLKKRSIHMDIGQFTKGKLYTVGDGDERRYLCITEGTPRPIVNACLAGQSERVLADVFSIRKISKNPSQWFLTFNITTSENEVNDGCRNPDDVSDEDGNYGLATHKHKLLVKTICKKLTNREPTPIEYIFLLEFDKPRLINDLAANSKDTFRLRAFCHKEANQSAKTTEHCYVKVLPSGKVKMRSFAYLAKRMTDPPINITHDLQKQFSINSSYDSLFNSKDVSHQLTKDLNDRIRFQNDGIAELTSTTVYNTLYEKVTLFELVKFSDSNG